MKLSPFIFLLFLFNSIFLESKSCFAQIKKDTLDNVIINDKQSPSHDIHLKSFAPGIKIITIDSNTLKQYQDQSLATLISQQLPVFVKSLGVNGLSSLTFRGASASQSAVYWNGVPIQNAALGIADIGALPVFFMNQVQVVYGSAAALMGSGNVGGALMLESDPLIFNNNNHSLSVSMAAGSFNTYSGTLQGSISGNHWYFSIKGLLQTAENDFPFTNAIGNKVNMTNALMTDNAVQLHLGYKFNSGDILSLAVWYQDYDRQIPPALFENTSDKQEKDRSLRTMLDWVKHIKNNTFFVKSAFIRDEINYSDSVIGLFTANTAWQYHGEAGWRKNWNQFGKLLLDIPYQTSWMVVANSTKTITKPALVLAYEKSFFKKVLDVAVNGRSEWYNSNDNILLPGADAAINMTDWLQLKVNVQETYRTPTLNELYYNPGGNPELKPEHGWNEDAGYAMEAQNGRWCWLSNAAIYNRDIKDWIIWLGGAIWTPHNLAEVHSRGAETENTLQYSSGGWRLIIGVSTAYNLATTVASYIPNDGSIGKQIPYTPRYNGNAKAGVRFHSFSVNYIQSYTGYRFITSDESEYLLPYSTGNLQGQYSCTFMQLPLQFTAQCNNVWNTQYQVVSGRPMPGVNWLFGIKARLL